LVRRESGRDGGVERLAAFPGRNDLQRAAEALCPEVAEVGRWLQARFGNSRMTGSGSAVYARAGAGERPVATMPEGEFPEGWVGRMCRSLEEHPLTGWLG
jgi:4-diphosphocytidyl-2-C-methyl-D-erythritol kinase